MNPDIVQEWRVLPTPPVSDVPVRGPWRNIATTFLSASLYFSKRDAYWDRLCRDVVGRWLVGWLSRACTVAKRCILGYYGTLIGNPTPGIQWYKFRPPGVTPNRGMGPPWGAFCQITLTFCYRVVWLPDGESFLKICIFISTEFTTVTDTHTGRRMDWHRTTA